MVFEEIVDVKLLATKVLDSKYNCVTYSRNNPKHQHVVICVLPDYHLKTDDSGNFSLEDVDLNHRLRPATHGILVAPDGSRLHIFGVHLKANTDQSVVRLKQTQILADYMKGLKDPILVIGDFNTFGTDVQKMSAQFQGLTEVVTPEKYTWASTEENYPPAKLDRTWISKSLSAKVTYVHVLGPCNSNDDNALAMYNKGVSDHCPTKIILNLLAKTKS